MNPHYIGLFFLPGIIQLTRQVVLESVELGVLLGNFSVHFRCLGRDLLEDLFSQRATNRYSYKLSYSYREAIVYTKVET